MEHAIDIQTNQIIHISKLPRGIESKTKCFDCSEPVFAKRGDIRRHHFSHFGETNCNGESYLHYRAKELICKTKLVPYLPVNNNTKVQIREFQNASMEYQLGTFFTDVFLTDQDKQIAVEIKVTHGTEKEKIEYFQSKKLTAIEIDLSKYINKNLNKDELIKAIYSTPKNVSYLYSQTLNKNKKNEAPKKTIKKPKKLARCKHTDLILINDNTQQCQKCQKEFKFTRLPDTKADNTNRETYAPDTFIPFDAIAIGDLMRSGKTLQEARKIIRDRNKPKKY